MTAATARSALSVAAVLALTGCVSLIAPLPVPIPPSALPPLPAIASKITLQVHTPAPDLATLTAVPCDHFGGHFTGTYFYEVLIPVGVNVSYEYWLAPIAANISNDTVRAGTTMYYWIDGIVMPLGMPIWGQCGHSGEVPRHLAIEASSKLVWDPDWYIRSTTSVNKIDDEGVKCEVTLQNVDLTHLLEPALKRVMEVGFRKFDDAVMARTQFRTRAADIWKDVQQPISLGPSAWLQLNPESVTLAPISTVGVPTQELHSTLMLEARPLVVVGIEPAPTQRELPPLKPDPVADSGFHVIADVVIAMSQASEMLNDPRTGIVNKTFEADRHTLVIDKLTVGADGDKLAIALDVHSDIRPPKYEPAEDLVTIARNIGRFIGSTVLELVWRTDGRLYVRGTPTYDPGMRTVSFRDADYDVETRNLLLDVASWVLRTEVMEKLRSAELPVGNALDNKQAQLTQALNRRLDGAILTGAVTRLELQRVKPTSDVVVLRMRADGNANLDVQWH